MKINLSMLLCICFMLAVTTGCTNNKVPTDEGKSSVSLSENTESIDMDLTVLKSDVAYTVLSDVMQEFPDIFLGKRILISGEFYSTRDEETNQYYHYLLVEDEDACCGEEIEIIWKGEYVYPDDYPEDNETIEIVGIFSSYEKFGYTFYYLAVDGNPK